MTESVPLVDEVRDPIALLRGARRTLEAIERRLIAFDDADPQGGWRVGLQADPYVFALVLDSIAFAGEALAQVTTVIDHDELNGIARLVVDARALARHGRDLEVQRALDLGLAVPLGRIAIAAAGDASTPASPATAPA